MSAPYLARRVVRIVGDPRWGGGVRQDHIRELTGCDRKTLRAAIAIAYRRGQVDICWSWIVAPAPARREVKAA